MHFRRRVRLSTLRKSWAPAPQPTRHPTQTPPPTSRRLLHASISPPVSRPFEDPHPHIAIASSATARPQQIGRVLGQRSVLGVQLPAPSAALTAIVLRRPAVWRPSGVELWRDVEETTTRNPLVHSH